MRARLAPSLLLAAALVACRSAPPPDDAVGSATAARAGVSAPTAAPRPAGSVSSRPPPPPPPTIVTAEVAKPPSGDGFGARLGPDGWVGSKHREDGSSDLTFSPPGGAKPATLPALRPGVPHFVATPTQLFVDYQEHEPLGPELFRIERGAAKRVAGAGPAEWAFDLADGRALIVGTRGGKMMIAGRWHASIVGPGGATVVASADREESAWGAARLGDGFVVAVREPIKMAGASLEQKVGAIQGVLRGDGDDAASLAEPARGSLVYLDAEGRVSRREAIGPQRPEGLAVTDRGWLLVLGEGTLRGGLRDAALVSRGPDGPMFRVLASNLDTPTGLRQRGGWACLTELPSRDRGETYVVHCFDPLRGLHVATAPIRGMVAISDIEPGPPARVWISRHQLERGTVDDALVIKLP